MYDHRPEVRMVAASLFNEVDNDLNLGFDPIPIENEEHPISSTTTTSSSSSGPTQPATDVANGDNTYSLDGNTDKESGATSSSQKLMPRTNILKEKSLCNKECVGDCKNSSICLFYSGLIRDVKDNFGQELLATMESGFSSVKSP
jgi:hypothetical protein